MKAKELINIPFPDCSIDCEAIELLGAGECESVCPKKFDQTICPDCLKCYNGCDHSFPENFINGGAITCNGFERDEDSMNVLRKIKRKEKEIVEMYAKRGFFV
ncbi:MAG: hypothetical protein M0Q13_10105 [Methanothrix sp.]|jgi:hypothetical protein|nr:hypothetical protein [Methanothrix sp.]